MIDEKEIRLAIEHPRGTERRRLGPYREALRTPDAYAGLPQTDRDAIVRWVETRRIVRERTGLDNDPANLADPLLPLDHLRAHVIEGERIAAGPPSFGPPSFEEEKDGDLLRLVQRIRAARTTPA